MTQHSTRYAFGAASAVFDAVPTGPGSGAATAPASAARAATNSSGAPAGSAAGPAAIRASLPVDLSSLLIVSEMRAAISATVG